MRIVIDLQGAQSDSRLRGIGRYSLALAQAMIENGEGHEFIIALNGLFPDSIEPIRAQFAHLIPQENIRVWTAAPGLSVMPPENTWRRHAAELMRETFLDSLDADVVHITSLFDGFFDEAVHSIGLLPCRHATAVTFYDVIPLIESEIYLKPNPAYEVGYREKIANLQRADILLAISESSREEAIKYVKARPNQVVNIAASVDKYFKPIEISESERVRLLGRLNIHRPFVMYSGATDERKNHLRLIEAFALLPGSVRSRYQLVIAGRLPEVTRQKFTAHASDFGLAPDELVITGGVTDQELRELYNLCDLFAFPSWHEGFGLPALEAMACGAPVIASNTTSLPEVVGRSDALFNPFDSKSIAAKIEDVLENEELRQELKRHALVQANTFSWDKSARIALAKFEDWRMKSARVMRSPRPTRSLRHVPEALVESIAALGGPAVESDDWAKVARAIAQNHPRASRRQMYVDVSELVLRDSRSGIQRVVRSVLAALLAAPPAGYDIEPVFAVPGTVGYRYAKGFLNRFLGLSVRLDTDDAVEPRNGDIFLGLDLQHTVVIEQAAYFKSLRDLGVQVFFVIYDLIPILTPWAYPEDADLSMVHSRWLDVLQQQSGVLCISRSVADEFINWLDAFGTHRFRPLQIGWFHLGADVDQSIPSRGLDTDAPAVLEALAKRPTFLCVGTLEPRKGQSDALEAFELLWKRGQDVNLVLVGKQGWSGATWNIQRFVISLRSHRERGNRLFWLESISDEYLEAVYKESDCLIAASQAEGFGLPLIEAALHGLPIIARDIPVFREVAGNNAFYFEGSRPDALADRVEDWLALHSAGEAPSSRAIAWLTWQKSTAEMLGIVLNGRWYASWESPEGTRILASDARLVSQVGELRGREIRSLGEAGWLIYGPYLSVDAGDYRIVVRGRTFGLTAGAAHVDVVMNKAALVLAEASIVEPSSFTDAELVAMTVSVPEKCNDLEIRVWVSGSSDVAVSLIDISPAQAPVKPARLPVTAKVAASPAPAWVVVTGNVRNESELLSRLSYLGALKREGDIAQVVFSTWIGEIDKFPIIDGAIREYGFLLVESAEPDLICQGHFLHQMVTLANALEACPANSFVLRSRTDKCGPSDGFDEASIASFLHERRFHHDCAGQPVFRSRIGIMGYHSPSSTSPVLFFWNDRAYFGRREDLLRLTNINALAQGLQKFIPEQVLFTSPFALRWPSLNHFMSAANQQEVVARLFFTPNPPEKLDDLTAFLLQRPLFRAAMLTERHIRANYFFDLQTSKNFELDTRYRDADLHDEINLESIAAMVSATPQEPGLDVRIEVELIAGYLERHFGVTRVRQPLERASDLPGFRYGTPASSVVLRAG